MIPWSTFWERNYFFEWSAFLSGVMTNNYARGAISGLGLINVWAALAELADMFGGGDRRPDVAEPNQEPDVRNQP